MGFWKRFEAQLWMKAKQARLREREKRFAKCDFWVRVVSAACEGGPHTLCLIDEELHMSLLKSVFSKVTPGAREEAGHDVTWAANYPGVHELMTATPTSAGKVRVVSTLTVVVEDGCWKLGLRDRDHGVSLWVSGETFDGALASLEASLTLPVVPWRRMPEAFNRGRK